ncbi:MAG: deoxyguanosinetriphosphate triphosphohydrolase [Verrucomicrobiae bacterium]|nr:deoxyguanosinetriphosphate triphosphohydrolase [Verrucomicrobiae bacterium]
MPYTREQLKERERLTLAPYAEKSDSTRGRVYDEAPAEWRTDFQRDHDRVIHSRAFRRLEYKTQVFLNGSGDHLRTRLTHTIEVASIARNIAMALGLNEELAETIALAHDLGHPPFGHRGEGCLNQLMKEDGGFEHNIQSLRIVEYLERKYPQFPGLNLSWEVREGLAKHHTSYDFPEWTSKFSTPSPSLEAQVADIADEIAYYSHDLDDGLDAQLLRESDLERDVAIWREAFRQIHQDYSALPEETRCFFITRCIIDSQVKDVVRTTEAAIQKAGIRTPDEARSLEKSLVCYSPENREMNLALRSYLYENLYHSPEVEIPNKRATDLMEQLFTYLLKHPDKLPELSQEAIRTDGLKRALCDYIAGMTDRSVILEYERLFHSRLNFMRY